MVYRGPLGRRGFMGTGVPSPLGWAEGWRPVGPGGQPQTAPEALRLILRIQPRSGVVPGGTDGARLGWSKIATSLPSNEFGTKNVRLATNGNWAKDLS